MQFALATMLKENKLLCTSDYVRLTLNTSYNKRTGASEKEAEITQSILTALAYGLSVLYTMSSGTQGVRVRHNTIAIRIAYI